MTDLKNINTENMETALEASVDNKTNFNDANIVLKNSEEQALATIMAAKSTDELDSAVAIFNLSQRKKNAAREVVLNDLLDTAIKQTKERIEKNSDEFTNKDLLDYMNVTSAQLERTHKATNAKDLEQNIPQVVAQKNEVNINVTTGFDSQDRESRERVIAAALNILKAASASTKNTDEQIIDIKLTDTSDIKIEGDQNE